MGNPNCSFMLIAVTLFFSSQSPRGSVRYIIDLIATNKRKDFPKLKEIQMKTFRFQKNKKQNESITKQKKIHGLKIQYRGVAVKNSALERKNKVLRISSSFHET